jgi:hypothetical protein
MRPWYHFAILELTRLQDFQPDSRWIARVLGLNPDEVNIALARLMRLGLLEMVSTSDTREVSEHVANCPCLLQCVRAIGSANVF